MIIAANCATGQSLDGVALDLIRLDRRVLNWKEELGLIEQPEFPPKNVKMSDDAIKFHDRSHILAQDYLGMTSYDLRIPYNEDSLPPVFEEIITFFFSKVIHHPELDPSVKTTKDVLHNDIMIMKYLGYINDDSIFIKEISDISIQIGNFFKFLINRKDFPQFCETLRASTADCRDWEDLKFSG